MDAVDNVISTNDVSLVTPRTNSNNLIKPLLTDLYQITMCYSYWCDNRHDDPAVFDLYFRKNPFKGEYTIFAGLSDCLSYVENFKFTVEDIQYLKSIPSLKDINEKFWDYLLGLSTRSVKLYAFHEGAVCFPNLPLLRVEGCLGVVNLIETTLLNLTNYATLVTTCAARCRMAAGSGCKLFEFGLRRAQGPDGGFSASRYSYVGGFDATSNLLAGKEFDIPVCGTMSHAYIMSYFGTKKLANSEQVEHKYLKNKLSGKMENFTKQCLDVEKQYAQFLGADTCEPSELKAFSTFAWSFPESFLGLVDTYDVIRSGLTNFCVVAIALLQFGYKPIGIRIDSGDLAYLSRFSRDLFNRVARQSGLKDFREFSIVASNDINEETIYSLNDQKHAITSLGIGTHLVTCQSQPALGCVYKLVEINGKPCMKLSSAPEKITMPCRKSVFRLFGKDGNALLDLIITVNEKPPEVGQRILCRHPFEAAKRCYVTPSRVEQLLHLWWSDGVRTKIPPDLASSRKHCIGSLNYLTEDIKRSLNPTPYKVSVSEHLFNMLNELKLSLTPIGELS